MVGIVHRGRAEKSGRRAHGRCAASVDRDTIAVIEPRPDFAAKRLDRQIAHSRYDPTKHWPMNLPANSSWRAVAATFGRAHLFKARDAYSHWGSLA